MPSLSEAFAWNLKRLREAHGLTQEELAKRLGRHRNTIQKIEKGKGGNPKTIAQLAHFFGVEETDLVAAPSASPPAHDIVDCLREVDKAVETLTLLRNVDREALLALFSAAKSAQTMRDWLGDHAFSSKKPRG